MRFPVDSYEDIIEHSIAAMLTTQTSYWNLRETVAHTYKIYIAVLSLDVNFMAKGY